MTFRALFAGFQGPYASALVMIAVPSTALRTWRGTLAGPFEACEGDEPYVFVCYSHDDKALVYPELIRLRDSGVRIWYDEGIEAGSEWSESIAKHIEGCAAFLYFVTPRSVETEHCRRELDFAISQSSRVIAVYLEPTELPSGLKLSLNNRQAILRFDETPATFLAKLDRALGSLVVKKSGNTQQSKAQVAQPSVAVLPFANQSNDPEQEYFSDGIAEDVLAGLAGNRSVQVRAWPSSLVFKGSNSDPQEIAQRLNVRYLVNGSVRKHGKRVRVSARLTDVASNTDVWTQRYDRELTDIFAVQDEITAAIVEALGAQLSASPKRSVEPAAYDAYLAGRYHQSRHDWNAAIVSFTEAIECEPSYADAYAALAQIYHEQVTLDFPDVEVLEVRTRQLAAQALSLDPDQPIALGLLASHLPAQQAIDQLDALVRRHPNDLDPLILYGFVLYRVGRYEMAEKVFSRLLDLNPLAPEPPWLRGQFYAFTSQLSAARADAQRCEILGMPAAPLRTQIAILEEDLDAAKAECARPRQDWSAASGHQGVFGASVAFLEGDSAWMEEMLARVERHRTSDFTRWWIALLRGETDAAADWYESALRRGEILPMELIQGTALHRRLFPGFYASDRYRMILRNNALDPDSVAKLKVPALPF